MLFFFFWFQLLLKYIFLHSSGLLSKRLVPGWARILKNIKEWPCCQELLYALQQQVTLEELNIRIKQNSMKTARCIYNLQINIFLKNLLGSSCFTMVYQLLAVRWDNSATRVHIAPLFWISRPFRSLQNPEQGSLCYTVCSPQLSTLYIIMCIC